MISKIVIKKLASIIEIGVFFCILMYFSLSAIKKYKVEAIKQNLVKNRQSPFVVPFSSSLGRNPNQMLNGLIGQKINFLFKPFKKMFNYIFGTFIKMFKSFSNSIDKIRNLTRPIRNFFKQSALMFYKKLHNFMIGITYSLHKTRAALKRSVSGFNMMFHTLNHIRYSFESIMNSPLMPIAATFGTVLDWAGDAFETIGLCFSGNTLIDTLNGKIKIKDIIPGQQLDNNNIVIAVHTFINNQDMYNYNNIIVSGSHLVFENNVWLRVSDSISANKTIYTGKYIYCLSCTSGIIKIGGIIFKDFTESFTSFFVLSDSSNEPSTGDRYSP